MKLASCANQIHSAHERPQRLGDDDRAVLLLVVLDNRDERAADGEAGAVQRVDELRLAGTIAAELDARAARLKRLCVAAGRNLAIGVLAGQPDLDVVRLR